VIRKKTLGNQPPCAMDTPDSRSFVSAFSTLDSPCGQTRDHIFLQKDEDDHDRQRTDEGKGHHATVISGSLVPLR